MKNTALILGMAVIFCATAAFAEVSTTPADPKFNSVEWYRCDLGKVKYKQGLEEKESKYQCIKTSKVATGNDAISVVTVPKEKNETIYYYAVMPKDAGDHFSKMGYAMQCDKQKDMISGGIVDGQVSPYMLSPPEMSQSDGNSHVDAEYAKKGQVIIPAASIGGTDAYNKGVCKFSEQTCQFFSTETNKRFGLFTTALPTCK